VKPKKVTEAEINPQSLGIPLRGDAYGGGSSYMPRKGSGIVGGSHATPQAAIMKRGKGSLHGSYPSHPQKLRGR
jgi:hypothetical protein